eukprot:2331395-Rhodomonas_salina.3
MSAYVSPFGLVLITNGPNHLGRSSRSDRTMLCLAYGPCSVLARAWSRASLLFVPAGWAMAGTDKGYAATRHISTAQRPPYPPAAGTTPPSSYALPTRYPVLT